MPSIPVQAWHRRKANEDDQPGNRNSVDSFWTAIGCRRRWETIHLEGNHPYTPWIEGEKPFHNTCENNKGEQPREHLECIRLEWKKIQPHILGTMKP